MGQIDGLRAFAVMAVLLDHYWQSQYEIGSLAVRLFFIISGYVITAILLKARSSVEEGRISARKVAARFFVRRALRIFPAYYLLLVVAVLLNIDHIRTFEFWHAAQLSNILFSMRNEFAPSYTAHYWSLSIEEQFYLLWPLAILAAPRRFLVPIVAAIIAVAVAYRTISAFYRPDAFMTYYLTPVAFDSLGAGAMLALLQHHTGFDKVLTRSIAVALLIAAALTAALFGHLLGDGTWAYVGVLLGLANLPMLWLVRGASGGFAGPLGMVLSAGPVVYLGRISYGIYLYHLFVWRLCAAALHRVGIAFPNGSILWFLVGSLVVVALSAVSWHALEQPFNRLKGGFDMSGNRQASGERQRAA